MKDKYGDADLIDSTELENANKALSLQVGILSGAYETAQRRVKELEAEIEISQAEQSGLRQMFSEAKMQIMDLEMDKVELLKKYQQ